jgi:hypothetical protein
VQIAFEAEAVRLHLRSVGGSHQVHGQVVGAVRVTGRLCASASDETLRNTCECRERRHRV